MNSHTKPRKAVITGASSGIGEVYAKRLAHDGFDLVLIARSLDKLEIIAHQLCRETGRKVDIVSADLASCKDLLCIEELLRNDHDVDMLVNNAGVGSTQRLLEADPDAMTAMINLNVTALTRLTYAVVPGFVSRGRGTIINISSIVALAPELLNGVYGGSKAFVLAFGHSLQHELAGTGVRVQTVLPGGTATSFWDIAGTPVSQMDEARQSRMMSTEDMVDAALTGLKQGELVTLPALPDESYWIAYEEIRKAIRPFLTGSVPAARYIKQPT